MEKIQMTKKQLREKMSEVSYGYPVYEPSSNGEWFHVESIVKKVWGWLGSYYERIKAIKTLIEIIEPATEKERIEARNLQIWENQWMYCMDNDVCIDCGSDLIMKMNGWGPQLQRCPKCNF